MTPAAVLPVMRVLTVPEIDDAITGLHTQLKAWMFGAENGINPAEHRLMIDQLLELRLALT